MKLIDLYSAEWGAGESGQAPPGTLFPPTGPGSGLSTIKMELGFGSSFRSHLNASRGEARTVSVSTVDTRALATVALGGVKAGRGGAEFYLILCNCIPSNCPAGDLVE